MKTYYVVVKITDRGERMHAGNVGGFIADCITASFWNTMSMWFCVRRRDVQIQSVHQSVFPNRELQFRELGNEKALRHSSNRGQQGRINVEGSPAIRAELCE